MKRLIALAVALVVLGCCFVWWAVRQEPEELLAWWNGVIKARCDEQDERETDGLHPLPLLAGPERAAPVHGAWDAPSRWVADFHTLVHAYHSQILAEAELQARSMGGRDAGAHPLMADEADWNPVWVKFLGRYGPGLPTLRAIAAMFPRVRAAFVAVFRPGMTIADRAGHSRATYRYHYPLKVPEGAGAECGLEIQGRLVPWAAREGFAWDNTLPHSAWNRAGGECLVLMADVERDIGAYNAGTGFVYWALEAGGGRAGAAARPDEGPDADPEAEDFGLPDFDPEALAEPADGDVAFGAADFGGIEGPESPGPEDFDEDEAGGA